MPSGAWLEELTRFVVDAPGTMAGWRLSTNNLVVRRGDRFVREQATGAELAAHVSMRATAVVDLVLETCRTGAGFEEILAAVNGVWPHAPEQRVRDTIRELIRAGFLLTDLFPEPIADDPLSHLLSRLPEGSGLAEPLAEVRKQLHEADLYPPGAPERIEALTMARDLCEKITGHETSIMVDVAADADIRVPSSLLAEAAEAAGLLWSIMPTDVTLESYHSRFVDRYGTGSRVPLRHVVDAVTGLGDPDDKMDAEAAETPRTRIGALASLIAAAHGGEEVELDDATLAALRVREEGDRPSPSAEMYARVVAASREDLDAGRYLLAAYAGCTQEAGSTIGRFASLLPDLNCRVDGGDDGALVAEIVVHPRLADLATVAMPTGFTRTRICVGVAPRPGDLMLEDLELASDGHRLVLWSRSRDQEVIPALFSRIGSTYVPPVVRLLAQLAGSDTRPWHTWTWGPLSATAFQPRVRWRRTILSPARWRLPHTLVTAAGNAAAFDAGLREWRASTTPRPPRVVVAEETDRRLPLDLDDARDRALLRRYVRRGTDVVTEQPGGSDAVQGVVAGPDGRHALELVIPLRGRQPATTSQPSPRPRPAIDPVVHLPGGEWLSLAIPAPTMYHDDLLAHVGEVAERVRADVDRWFWLRYDNNAHGPHLRVRFRGERDTLTARILPAMSQWCAQLMAQGLVGGVVVEPYEPEVDRYGGPHAIEQAERVFHIDGEHVIAALAGRPDQGQRLMLIALSAVEIARTIADGDLAALGRPRLDKPARRRVNALRALVPERPASMLTEVAEKTWDRRGQALAAYRSVVPASRRADCASSLIHMHANRMGAGHDDERLARALAVQILAKEIR